MRRTFSSRERCGHENDWGSSSTCAQKRERYIRGHAKMPGSTHRPYLCLRGRCEHRREAPWSARRPCLYTQRGSELPEQFLALCWGRESLAERDVQQQPRLQLCEHRDDPCREFRLLNSTCDETVRSWCTFRLMKKNVSIRQIRSHKVPQRASAAGNTTTGATPGRRQPRER